MGIQSFTPNKYVRLSLYFVMQYSTDAIVHCMYLLVFIICSPHTVFRNDKTNSTNAAACCACGLLDLWSN